MADESNFRIHDSKGAWFRLNAVFDMEDPTPAQAAGGPAACPKFSAGGYTQATETGWTRSQHEAGILTKYSGRPGDEGVTEVPYVAPKGTSTATAASGENKATDTKTDAKDGTRLADKK